MLKYLKVDEKPMLHIFAFREVNMTVTFKAKKRTDINCNSYCDDTALTALLMFFNI